MLTRSPSRCGMLVLAGRGAHRTKMVRNGLLTERKVKPSKNSAQDEDEDATKGALNMVLHTMRMFSHSIATESTLKPTTWTSTSAIEFIKKVSTSPNSAGPSCKTKWPLTSSTKGSRNSPRTERRSRPSSARNSLPRDPGLRLLSRIIICAVIVRVVPFHFVPWPSFLPFSPPL